VLEVSCADYVCDAFADYDDVCTGKKPLLIVSSGKSAYACEALAGLAKTDGHELEIQRFVCEDNEVHTHAFISAKGSPYAKDAVNAIWRNIERVAYDGWDPRRSREALQLELGLMLGYSAQRCLDFMRSDLGRTCPCDCCGGPETAEVSAFVTDGNASRFTVNAYQY
jgi:hypothetical protein